MITKKKLFLGLDIVILLIYFYPIIFPERIEKSLNITMVLIALVFALAYYIIRSKVTKTPFMNICIKTAVVAVGVFLVLMIIDMYIGRFSAPCYDVIRSFESIVAIMISEIYYTISEMLQK